MSTASPPVPASPTIGRRARDALWLTGQLRRARALPDERRARLRAYLGAALDRTAVADQLTDERGAVAALLLYRDALPLLVAAIALGCDPDFQPADEPAAPVPSPWETLADLRQRGLLRALPRTLERARAALDAPGPLGFDRLPASTLLARQAAVRATVRRLRRLVEARAPSEIKGSRVLRLAVAAGVLALLVTGIVLALRRPDLALGKPVAASSRHPGSTAPADNSGLTNGVIEPTYGIETAPGPGWVMIDLQEILPVSTVKIFNRRDALFDAGLPLTLETSLDGARFTAVQTRAQPFSASSPWVYRAPAGTRVRFLRVRSNSLVALTEVEVY